MGHKLVLWRHGVFGRGRHIGPRQVCVEYLPGEEGGQARVLAVLVHVWVVYQYALHKGPRIFNLALLVAYAVKDRFESRVPPSG
jgi:hypothetical protein